MPEIEKTEKKLGLEEVSFSDVLAAIVTGVAHARATCDREVTQIAQIYKQDLFLQSFSVPRLRVDQVVVDIPVNVCGLNKAQTVEMQEPDKICARIERAFDELISNKKSTIKYLISINDENQEYQSLIQEQVETMLAFFGPDSNKRKQLMVNIINELRKLKNKIVRNKQFSFCLSQLQVMLEMKRILKRCINELLEVKDYSEILPENRTIDSETSPEEKENILNSKHTYELINFICERVIYPSIAKEEVKSDVLVNVVTEQIKNKTTPGTQMRIQIKIREEGMVWQNAKSEKDKEDQWNLTLE